MKPSDKPVNKGLTEVQRNTHLLTRISHSLHIEIGD
jgi:hypothetical protein